MTAGQEHLEQRPWRQGRTVGRTVYADTGGGFKTHELIGMMETPELAGEVCDAHNRLLEESHLAAELAAGLERHLEQSKTMARRAASEDGAPNYFDGRADAYARVLGWLPDLPAGERGDVT